MNPANIFSAKRVAGISGSKIGLFSTRLTKNQRSSYGTGIIHV
jgi:hypothetical protein